MMLTEQGLNTTQRTEVEELIAELRREVEELRGKVDRFEQRLGPDSESWRF
jgi:hypothetical protein